MAAEVDALLVVTERAAAGHARLEERRFAVGLAPVAVRGGNTVPMGVDHVLRHPVAVGEVELVGAQFAHADHGVLLLPIDVVAVNGELVLEAPVGSVRFALLEGRGHDPRVHEADLGGGGGVGAQRTGVGVGLRLVAGLLHLVDLVRGARRVDVVLDVRLFEGALVRIDLEVLDQRGVGHADGERGQHDETGTDCGDLPVALDDPQQHQRRHDQGGDRQDRLGGDEGIDIREGRALELRVAGVQQMVALHPVLGGEDQQVAEGDDAEVPACRLGDGDTGILAPGDAAVHEVPGDGGDGGGDHDEVQKGERHVDDRQMEHVEPDVVVEDRVRGAEVLRVHRQLHRLPRPRGGETAEDAESAGDGEGDEAAQRLHSLTELLHRLFFAGDRRMHRPMPVGEAEGEEQRQGDEGGAQEEEDHLGDPAGADHVDVAELAVPEVGGDDFRSDHQRDQERTDDEKRDGEGCEPALAVLLRSRRFRPRT